MSSFNRRITNIIEYTPPGGQRVYLSPLKGSNILTEEGTGMPPIEHITERGPWQHGVTPKDYFLQPRVLQYRLRQEFCSASAYQNGREALLDLLRPNYDPDTITGKLTKYLPNGHIRSLDVAIIDGPGFKARTLGRWDEWAIDEILRFIAFNPIAYDPTAKVVTFSRTGGGDFPYTFPFMFAIPEELSFPIEFPISFYGYDVTSTLTYLGTWQEYPTIVITGPASPQIQIYNDTTGEQIKIAYDLAPGDTITIALTYSTKTVTHSDGTNLAAYVSDDSDLATFHLQPGDNSIRVVIMSPGVNSSAAFTYYDRFIGY